MIQSLYLMTLMMTMTFMFVKHPLSMGFILLIQTILIAMITGLLAYDYWFSYILFMVMIGGMLVLFIYMTSVASNEKFNYSVKLTFMIMSMILLSTILYFMDPFSSYQMTVSMDTAPSSTDMLPGMWFKKYLNLPESCILLMLIIYLLVTLIAVVKITDITHGPLRQKF